MTAPPDVAGRTCLLSLAELEHRARDCIGREQEKPLPDNALIDTLCNAVRLAREVCDSSPPKLAASQAREARLREALAELQSASDAPQYMSDLERYEAAYDRASELLAAGGEGGGDGKA